MNFLVGFILLVSGGQEKDSFWLFASMLKSTPMYTINSNPYEPKFEGIKGFYKKGFPLLQLYFYQFEAIFEDTLPELFQHFQELCIPNPLWLQKWF